MWKARLRGSPLSNKRTRFGRCLLISTLYVVLMNSFQVLSDEQVSALVRFLIGS